MSNYFQRAEKIMARLNQLASISEDSNCITRTYGTKAFVEGQILVKEWMELAGLQTWIDAIGNVRGKLVCADLNAKTFVIGSHIDTVVNAGKFDGPLGVIMGIDLVENIIKSGANPFYNIEIIAFCDEEGVRFQTTFLGSKAVAGTFDKNLLNKKDKNEITLAQAIETIGGELNNIDGAKIEVNNWLGYFEIHIEQGPVLYEKNIPCAIVEAIAGQCRAEIIFTGTAGHAGTVPMDRRQDALCCASEFIIETEAFALENKSNLVATVGKLDVIHAASNVIAGKVICSVDIRSADEKKLNDAIEKIKNKCEIISTKRNIKWDWQIVLQTKPVHCDEKLNEFLTQSIALKNQKLVSLVSGAGHDGVSISLVAPICMLFVRCFEGISHNPLENAEINDILATIEVSDNFLNKLLIKS